MRSRRVVLCLILFLFISGITFADDIRGTWLLENVFTIYVDHPTRMAAGLDPSQVGAVSEIVIQESVSRRGGTRPIAVRAAIETSNGSEVHQGVAMPVGNSLAVAFPGQDVSFQIYYTSIDRDSMWYQYSMTFDAKENTLKSAMNQDQSMLFIGIMRRSRR